MYPLVSGAQHQHSPSAVANAIVQYARDGKLDDDVSARIVRHVKAPPRQIARAKTAQGNRSLTPSTSSGGRRWRQLVSAPASRRGSVSDVPVRGGGAGAERNPQKHPIADCSGL